MITLYTKNTGFWIMYLLKKNIHTTTMKTNIRFTFLIVKLIPFALLSQLRSLASSESNMASFYTSRLRPLEFCSSVSRQQCCSIDCIEYMQFGFRFQILLFTTSLRFQLRHWHTWHTRHTRHSMLSWLSSVRDSVRSKITAQ